MSYFIVHTIVLTKLQMYKTIENKYEELRKK